MNKFILAVDPCVLKDVELEPFWKMMSLCECLLDPQFVRGVPQSQSGVEGSTGCEVKVYT